MQQTQAMDAFFQSAASWIKSVSDFLETSWNQPHAPEFLGLAALSLALFVAVRKIRAHFRPIKLFDNRVGVVELSRKALDELVQSVCYSMGALNRPDVKIFMRRGRLCMCVSLKLESGQKLTDASAEIQTALTSAFREHLGVEKLGRIDVRVLGFKGLIYNPTTKFLPPVRENDDDADIILSEKSPVFDSVDDSKKEDFEKK